MYQTICLLKNFTISVLLNFENVTRSYRPYNIQPEIYNHCIFSDFHLIGFMKMFFGSYKFDYEDKL